MPEPTHPISAASSPHCARQAVMRRLLAAPPHACDAHVCVQVRRCLGPTPTPTVHPWLPQQDVQRWHPSLPIVLALQATRGRGFIFPHIAKVRAAQQAVLSSTPGLASVDMQVRYGV